MELFIIPLIALGASLLTFFSGFGLGTLLTPAFALFFPLELSVTLTAIVHFLNNIFKFSLVGSFADKNIVIKFGIPAALSALIGAWALGTLSNFPAILDYHILGYQFELLPVKVIFSLLLIFFTLFEVIPSLHQLQFSRRYLTLGGVLSGFFGGLSGHQGALRAAFLSKTNLTKEQFIATGNAIALLIDVSRLGIYVRGVTNHDLHLNLTLLLVSTLSAFLGAYWGNKLLKKFTYDKIKVFVTVSLFIFGIALGMGII